MRGKKVGPHGRLWPGSLMVPVVSAWRSVQGESKVKGSQEPFLKVPRLGCWDGLLPRPGCLGTHRLQAGLPHWGDAGKSRQGQLSAVRGHVAPCSVQPLASPGRSQGSLGAACPGGLVHRAGLAGQWLAEYRPGCWRSWPVLGAGRVQIQHPLSGSPIPQEGTRRGAGQSPPIHATLRAAVQTA